MRCSISECREEAIETVQISFRETRNLCEKHYSLYRDRGERHLPKFSRASEMQDGP